MDEGESSETLKAKANDCFAKRDFYMAAELYSKAIEKEQADKSLLAILYSNRSAARIELGQDREAVDDASIALGFRKNPEIPEYPSAPRWRNSGSESLA